MENAYIDPIFANEIKKRPYPYYNNEEDLKIRAKLFKSKLKNNDTKEIINIFEIININISNHLMKKNLIFQ